MFATNTLEQQLNECKEARKNLNAQKYHMSKNAICKAVIRVSGFT